MMKATPIFDSCMTELMRSAEYVYIYIRGEIETAYDDESSISVHEIFADFMYNDHSEDAIDFGFDPELIYGNAKILFDEWDQARIDAMMIELAGI